VTCIELFGTGDINGWGEGNGGARRKEGVRLEKEKLRDWKVDKRMGKELYMGKRVGGLGEKGGRGIAREKGSQHRGLKKGYWRRKVVRSQEKGGRERYEERAPVILKRKKEEGNRKNGSQVKQLR